MAATSLVQAWVAVFFGCYFSRADSLRAIKSFNFWTSGRGSAAEAVRPTRVRFLQYFQVFQVYFRLWVMAATSSSCRFVRMFSLGPFHSELFQVNRIISERQAAVRPPRRFARLEFDHHGPSSNIFKFSCLFSSLSHDGHKFKLPFCSDVFLSRADSLRAI